MLFHIFCRNSGGIIKSQWVAKPTTTFSWELPMPSNAEQLICSLIIAMLLPWWADSPSLWPALALVLLVFYLKWSCTRSKAPSHHLSCLHLFLAFARLVSVCQCFSVHWRCPDGIWCSKCKFKNAKNRNIYLGGFFACSLAATSQTIFGLYLHIINNWVLLGMKPAWNIHCYSIIQPG